ncbi:hypothetical protein [Lactovum miscens]|uniref:Uncharacterized protein n=1 Tax=Lactovum miscens TaxID=190387 RepID=A0A841C5W6_9LACT|nr:hypothetical protein [Lactovum miscens]MBB5888193.1 hypothetical protein [Lactovum miscens]
MTNNTRLFGEPLKNFNNESNFNLDVSSAMTAAFDYENSAIITDLPSPVEFMKKFRLDSNVTLNNAYGIPVRMESKAAVNVGVFVNAAAGLNVGTVAVGATFVVLALAVIVAGAVLVLGGEKPNQNSAILKSVNQNYFSSLVSAAMERGGLKFATSVVTEFILYVKEYNGMESYE